MRSSWTLVTLALILGGCGSPRTTPTVPDADAALTKALDAWKAGAPNGEIAGTTPKIVVVDSEWKAGRKLDAYEIVGPIEGEQPPRYRVKLTTAGSKAPVEATYILVGSDPLYVYRDTDFDRMINMDNNPGGRPR